MCIAVAKPKGFAVTKKILQNCFDNNPDGAGFCVEIDGNLVVNKGYFTFEDFYTAYQPYENEKALIHFRIRTHGDLNKENCHPFFVSDDIAMIHNGIIYNVSAKGTESDTIVFNNMHLRPIVSKYGQDALTSSALKPIIEHFIGGSKLALFVKGQEDFVFFNEHLGNYSKEGIWFSNSSWQTPKPSYSPPISLTNFPKTDYKRIPSFPVTEVDYITNMHGDYISFGTLVSADFPINHPAGTIPKGATGEVERVYSNRTMDVDFFLEGKIEKIYSYALKVITDPSVTEKQFFL